MIKLGFYDALPVDSYIRFIISFQSKKTIVKLVKKHATSVSPSNIYTLKLGCNITKSN